MGILVTNDDGDSEGLHMLLEAARKFGDAYAIVPSRQRSAVSGALTLHKPLRLHKIGEEVYTINGTPTDCALFAIHSEEFKKPSLVLSGINWGDNTGIGTLLGSGTVGACWRAALKGVPAIAFSLAKTKEDWRRKESWGDRTALVEKVVEIITMLKPKLKPDRFFNVNLPHDVSDAKIVHVKKMQRERYGARIEKRLDPDNNPYYWIIGVKRHIDTGTDAHEVLVKGNISVVEVPLSIFERG